MRTQAPSSANVHPFIEHHVSKQTDALDKMAGRLAPEQNHQTIDFNADALGTVKTMTLSAGFNKIEHNLLAGKILVYLGGNAPQNLSITGVEADLPKVGHPDFTLDATVPGPIYFPVKQHRAIAFLAFAKSTGGTNPTGRIHVENY